MFVVICEKFRNLFFIIVFVIGCRFIVCVGVVINLKRIKSIFKLR